MKSRSFRRRVMGATAAMLIAIAGCGGAKKKEAEGPVQPTPSEKVWTAVVALEEEKAKLIEEQEGPPTPAYVQELLRIEKRMQEARVRLARHGAIAPPEGVPAEMREDYDRAVAKREQAEQAYSERVGEAEKKQLSKQLEAAKAKDPIFARKPFRLSAEIRAAENRVTIFLENDKPLKGPRRKRMLEALKKQARADHYQEISRDGKTRVILANVWNFDYFSQSVDIGLVSNVDKQNKSFTLAVDPTMFPPEPGDPEYGL